MQATNAGSRILIADVLVGIFIADPSAFQLLTFGDSEREGPRLPTPRSLVQAQLQPGLLEVARLPSRGG